jgi:hypothetical protein
MTDPSGLYDFGKSLGGKASDKEILENTCAGDVCTQEEINQGKRTKADAQKIVDERKSVISAMLTLESLLSLSEYSKNLDANETERLRLAVNALGTQNDGNGVVIESSSLLKLSATVFEIHHNEKGGSTIYLPTNTRGIAFILGLVHEGQHVRDFTLWFGKGGKRGNNDITNFEYEVRGFEIEGIAAKARGLTRHSTAGNATADELIWDKSWKPADVQTLRHTGAINRVTRDYAPLSPTNQGIKFSQKFK